MVFESDVSKSDSVFFCLSFGFKKRSKYNSVGRFIES